MNDHVKLISKPYGDELFGKVVQVSDPHTCIVDFFGRAPRNIRSATLIGIRIYDCERQAAISYARSLLSAPSLSNGGTDDLDLRLRDDFSLATYHSVYPDTKSLGIQDSYLDYRARWKRGSEYRVIQGKDIFNLSAPYTSNLLTTVPGTDCKDLKIIGRVSAGSASIGGGFLTVGLSNVWIDAGGTLLSAGAGGGSNPSVVLSSGALRTDEGNVQLFGHAFAVNASGIVQVGLGGGLLQIDPVLANVSVASGAMVASTTRVDLCSGLLVADSPSASVSVKEGIAFDFGGPLHAKASAIVDGTLSVAQGVLEVTSDGVCISCSDGAHLLEASAASPAERSVSLLDGCWLVTAGSVNAFSGALVVTSGGNVVAGSSASNIVVSAISSSVALGGGEMVVSLSNTVIGTGSGSTTTVQGTLNAVDRVGIGMYCLGDESGSVDGTGTAMATRLAVDGDVYVTGAVVSLSDAKVKSDIRPIENALEKVARLGGYTFATCAGTCLERRHTGVLAHEVAQVLPEAVYDVPGRPGYSSVAYGNVIGLVIQAINELSSRLDNLRLQ